jgi:putative cell wall-binding protein
VLDNATWSDMINGGGQQPKPVERVAGSNRFGTAANLASFYPTGRVVYVTTGRNFPDALASSARAGQTGNPVLLTEQGYLPSETKAELNRIRPSRIYVVGGGAAVSGAVVDQLKGYTSGTVSRLSGTNRYGTAAKVAQQFGTDVPVVYVATGTNYPDALSGAARAAYNDGPRRAPRSRPRRGVRCGRSGRDGWSCSVAPARSATRWPASSPR